MTDEEGEEVKEAEDSRTDLSLEATYSEGLCSIHVV